MFSNILLANTATDTLSQSWAWYLVRASGLLAFALLILLMVSGIGHVTGWTYKLLPPVRAWMVHKAIALALMASIAIHIIGLLFDSYVSFSVADIFIPFLNTYSNRSTVFGLNIGWLAIPTGILAAYGSFVVTLSSLDTVGWIRNHKRLWRWVHIISYLVMLLVIIHALTVGTEFTNPIWRILAYGMLFLFILGIISRFRRSNISYKD